MATKVIELELNQPFPDLKELDLIPKTQFQILVRKDDQPIGYIWVQPPSKRFLEEPYLRHEIEKQLFDQLNWVEFERMLGAEAERLTLDGNDQSWPMVTVAICSRDRAKSLEYTLESLMRLDYPHDRLEIIVVDNAPVDDSTVQVVAKFPQIRYVIEPRPGLNWARNRAIREASGQIVAYTDDDTRVDSLWVRALVRHFANPAVMCVTGLVAPAELETKAQELFERYGGFGRGFELRYYTRNLQEYWPYWLLAAGNFGTGCNMTFRRSLFDKIGLFDEALDVGTPSSGAGDHDLFYRTLRAGYILVYEPRALIWHYHRRELAELRSQLADFGRGVYAFWAKTFLFDRQMRWPILALAASWYRQWFFKRLFRRRNFSRKLVLAEAVGALQGPVAYLIARRQARRIARQFSQEASIWSTSTTSRAGDRPYMVKAGARSPWWATDHDNEPGQVSES